LQGDLDTSAKAATPPDSATGGDAGTKTQPAKSKADTSGLPPDLAAQIKEVEDAINRLQEKQAAKPAGSASAATAAPPATGRSRKARRQRRRPRAT